MINSDSDSSNKQIFSLSSFKFFKSGLVGKPLTVLDWAAFLLIAVFCMFAYCHQDILNTASSSFSYITGHFTDFYQYNVENNVEPMNNYMPSTYLLFAIWNLPLFLLGVKRVPWGGSPFIAVMWYKLLPILFFLGCGYVLYKIGSLVGFGEKKSKVLTYVFLTSPVGLFGPIVMGQYDSFTVFFVLLGLYFYLKNDNFKFVLFFSIAITFKYFALLIFLPLLLLKEKNVVKILKNCCFLMVPFLLECLFYLKSPMFHKGVFGFAAKDNLFAAGFDLGFAKVSLFVVCWVVLLCWTYLTKLKSDDLGELFKWAVFFANFIICFVFATCIWHPQWLILAVPFMVMGTFLSKNPKLFLLVDVAMFALLVVFSAHSWLDGVDQHMLSKGIFKKLMSPVDVNYGIPFALCNLLNFGRKSLFYSLISGLFIANLIFKHPKFCVEKVDCTFDKIVDNWAVVRGRFCSVAAFWIVPTMICLVSSIFSPFFILKNSNVFRGEVFGRGIKNAQANQIFIPKENYEISELQLLLTETGDRPIEVDRNVRSNMVKLSISMFREADGKNFFNKTYEVGVTEIRPVVFKVDKTIVEAGTRYKFCINLADENGNTVAFLGKTYRGFDENNHAVIDGHMQPFSYCVNILGKRI